MKLRLLFRTSNADCEGKLVQYHYATHTVDIELSEAFPKPWWYCDAHAGIYPEVIGGEWLQEEGYEGTS